MKRSLIAAIVLLCVGAILAKPTGKAADTIYFSVINTTILPLNDATMPEFYNGQIYMPYSFFNSDELGVYSNAAGNTALIYSGTKYLRFDAIQATIIDQDGELYHYVPYFSNGTIYVPAKFICDFFGLMPPTVIRAAPADIVRVRTTASTINDQTFPNIGYIKTQLQAEYEKYTGVVPSVTPPPSPSENITPTYRDISVYLSFYDLSGGEMAGILDALASTSYKACFFVTKGEIEENAGLLRRAVGKGHTIGIRLTGLTAEGAYQEYQEASALLFEAALAKTVIVTAMEDAAETVEEMAKENSLVFWRPTENFGAGVKLSVAGLTGKLSTVKGTRESLYFSCSEGVSGVIRPFLSYLYRYEYNVRRITETTIPVMTA